MVGQWCEMKLFQGPNKEQKDNSCLFCRPTQENEIAQGHGSIPKQDDPCLSSAVLSGSSCAAMPCMWHQEAAGRPVLSEPLLSKDSRRSITASCLSENVRFSFSPPPLENSSAPKVTSCLHASEDGVQAATEQRLAVLGLSPPAQGRNVLAISCGLPSPDLLA
ncbi:hypothetical protein AOLI_G00294260 [Acnodon oligacanthus]